jgi:ATP synthase F subunit
MIRGTVDSHDKSIPAILEIPSKEHQYDSSKDSILRRARVSLIFVDKKQFWLFAFLGYVQCR